MSGTNAILTQIATEEWGTGTPLAQLTQIAIEEWGPATLPQVRLTQIAIEEWASVTTAVATRQARVMVMA